MTTIDTPSESSDSVLLAEMDEETAVKASPRRRRPAPKANLFWRFVFPLFVAGAGVGVLLLWIHGTKVVLASTDGELVEIVTDPAKPGFEAFVDPTPTMILLHEVDGELTGVTVMARTLLDNGGQIVLLSSDLRIDSDVVAAVEPILLRDAYLEGGPDLVEGLVSDMFGFGFIESAVLTTEDLGNWMRLAEPIPFRALSDLRQIAPDGTSEVWLGQGEWELDGDVAAEVYSFRNPGEPDANRNERQLDLWVNWLREIDLAEDVSAATLPFDDGLSAFLRILGKGSVEVELLPAGPVRIEDDQPAYALDETQINWLRATARRMVPLPIAPTNSNQPRLRLLNGTEEVSRRDAALDRLIDIGAQIAVVGNAREFGVERTTVIYYQVADAARAEELASTLGALLDFDEQPEQPVDLTVVVGLDWEIE